MITSGVSEPHPVRVLVVDDALPIRLLCRVNLEAEELDVQEAATGEDALTIAVASPAQARSPPGPFDDRSCRSRGERG